MSCLVAEWLEHTRQSDTYDPMERDRNPSAVIAYGMPQFMEKDETRYYSV